jgi:hypothetical protein
MDDEITKVEFQRLKTLITKEFREKVKCRKTALGLTAKTQ